MSLLDTPLREIILASLSAEVWHDLWKPIAETLYMTAISSLIVLVIGLLGGIILTVMSPDGLHSVRVPYTILGWFINILRSLPQMIMIIMYYRNFSQLHSDVRKDCGVKSSRNRQRQN